MKLIDDKSYLYVQINWFDKQIKSMDVANWEANTPNTKDVAVRECLKDHVTPRTTDLEALRELLNATGLKKLSNTLASAKKRNNSNKKSLQLMLDKNVISKLETTAKNKSMTISELITASNNLDAGLSIDAQMALNGLVIYQKATQIDVLNNLLIEAQTQTVEEIRKTLPDSITSGNEALRIFLGEDD
jgi:predicted transcriptional regulator